MKLGVNWKTGLEWVLTSWKSQDDPGTGDSTCSLYPNQIAFPQFFMYKGLSKYWRSDPGPSPNLFTNEEETYYSFNANAITRTIVTDSAVKRLTWDDGKLQWKEDFSAPKSRCDWYRRCGANSKCSPDNVNQFECECLPGYEPKSISDWNQKNGSGGCVNNRVGLFKCGDGDGFVKVERVKFPDTSIAALSKSSMSDKECRHECLINCSCTAYLSTENEGLDGCITWYDDLMDILGYTELGRDLYVRVNATVLAAYVGKSQGFLESKGMLAIPILSAALALGEALDETQRHPELQFFDLDTIIAATDQFSCINELGHGGFGSVYKGKLPNEQNVAVKRLSKTSGQGIEELKNEVALIARLQHRNLVKLLGCCIMGEERILVLEYMPNKSLDSFLFDHTRRSVLDWERRFEIINGIARGILYLHQDSRLRIIHRDLKPSNVLLDAEMNPKISDFGMARIFHGNQLQDKTSRIVGTYGYMSPEYAIFGRFSTKSDVFSFGVIMLEIVSGQKINGTIRLLIHLVSSQTGMKLGLNRETGLDSFITSWKSEDDPGTGDYSYRLNLTGAPQFILYNRSSKYFRTAMWPWSPSPSTTPYAYDYNFVNNQDETSLIDSSDKSSEISRLVVNHNGILQHLTWNDVESRWKEMWAAPKFRCDPYGHCGAFSECSLDNIQSECSCLPGYEPSSSGNWSEGIWSDGCVSKQVEVSNKCGKNFVKVEHVKLPDASISALLDTQMGESECKRACQNNCSCVAYASLQIDGGGGCMAWYGELMDTLILAEQGRDFYVRADGTEAAENDRKPSFLRRRGMLAVLILPAVLALSVIMMAYWWLIKRKTEAIILRRTWGRQYSHFSTFNEPVVEHKVGETRRHPDLQLFYLSTIKAATDDFSLANKLGEGGFGSVYKGHLSNQQKIAVKRLSKSSRQGVEEFKNEVTLIAKLQHRNLVKLLGCCIEEEEKLLIYEYLPNKSLDFFLFDQTRRSALDWRNRFAIITGVARGILYLHEDSRLRIVHRDLKASNILLDADMKPKISDFGLARIFDGDQLQDVTRKIVGTYGYMSPEYAGYGKFSTKSDVFSFGVIVLEIISGKKNNASYEEDHSINLIGHVWDLWREHSILDIVDVLLESYNIDEVLRCLQIGLLCLEEDTTDRPTMSEVVLMLSGERALASPQRPAFIFKKTCHNSSGLLITERFSSTNDITLTDVVGR
ncbi:hypothetical protein ACLB2K_024265 [Fragaria x ananassa]